MSTAEQQLADLPDAHRLAFLERERKREQAVRFANGSDLVLELVDAGQLHETADRRCLIREEGAHVHDGARCIRCRGRHDDTIRELGQAIVRDGDVIRAYSRIDAAERELEAANAELGRAVHNVHRQHNERHQAARP
jgi:hypothetical protein